MPFDLVKGGAFGQDCPRCTRNLVGQSDDRHVVVAPLQQPRDPTRSLRPGNHGSGPRDQQGTRVGISTLGDAQLLGLAPGAHLSWCQAYPSCKLARRFERREVANGCHQSGGR